MSSDDTVDLFIEEKVTRKLLEGMGWNEDYDDVSVSSTGGLFSSSIGAEGEEDESNPSIPELMVDSGEDTEDYKVEEGLVESSDSDRVASSLITLIENKTGTFANMKGKEGASVCSNSGDASLVLAFDSLLRWEKECSKEGKAVDSSTTSSSSSGNGHEGMFFAVGGRRYPTIDALLLTHKHLPVSFIVVSAETKRVPIEQQQYMHVQQSI